MIMVLTTLVGMPTIVLLIDAGKPIAIVSVGSEREIWFCPDNDKSAREAVLMPSGSLLRLAAGMQQTHFHRISK